MIKKQTQRVVMLAVCSLFFYAGNAQVKIGDNPTTISTASLLELESTSQGFLPPRMTEMQRDAITTPVNGLIVYCTDCNTTGCLSIYINSTWTCTSDAAVSVSVADPGVVSGTYANGVAFTGTNQVSFTITNNSLSTVGPIDFNSAVSITGGTATFSVASAVSASASYSTVSINAGGSTTLTYNMTGTPSSTGTLEFAFSSVGGLSASATATITQGDATFSLPQVQSFASVNDGATPTYAIVYRGKLYDGYTFTVPYTGGLGSYDAFTGTAQLLVGEAGDSNNVHLTYATNTFSASGTITVTVHVDGDDTFDIATVAPGATDSFASFGFDVNGITKGNIIFRAVSCGAYVATGVFKSFDCYNLGATGTEDPNALVAENQGAYYQWGRDAPATQPAHISDATIGSYGSQGGNSNNGRWTSTAGGGPGNPCSTGYRVPSRAEWNGVRDTSLNTLTYRTTTGWTNSASNYTSGLSVGPNATTFTLTLPASGVRFYSWFNQRGSNGYYWSSTEANDDACSLGIESNTAVTSCDTREAAFPIRCVLE